MLTFRGVPPFQDHVAVAFGSGVPSACVVDIGDQKTSVSCVEDGMSIRESRVSLRHSLGSVPVPVTDQYQSVTVSLRHNLESVTVTRAEVTSQPHGRSETDGLSHQDR